MLQDLGFRGGGLGVEMGFRVTAVLGLGLECNYTKRGVHASFFSVLGLKLGLELGLELQTKAYESRQTGMCYNENLNH